MKRDLAFIGLHISGKTGEEFDNDEVLQDSMMFRLIQISENAKKVSDAFKAEHNDIPWADQGKELDKLVSDCGAIGGANDRCRQAAREAMNGSTPVGNCLYFRTVIPEINGQIIGGHVFY